MIRLGVHIHHVVDGKRKKAMKKSKMLIKEVVNWTPNAMISTISLSAMKIFLAKHLFNDRGDDNFKLLKAKQLGQI